MGEYSQMELKRGRSRSRSRGGRYSSRFEEVD